MTTKTSTKKLGDFLKSEYDYRYSRREISYTNGSGSDVTLVIGQPFSIVEATGVATPIVAGDEANAEVFLLTPVGVVVADGETQLCTAILRGPALANKDAFPDNDLAGDPYDKDALAAVAEALVPPIIMYEEVNTSNVEEQTT